MIFSVLMVLCMELWDSLSCFDSFFFGGRWLLGVSLFDMIIVLIFLIVLLVIVMVFILVSDWMFVVGWRLCVFLIFICMFGIWSF